MFFNLSQAKKGHKIAKNSTTKKAKAKKAQICNPCKVVNYFKYA